MSKEAELIADVLRGRWMPPAEQAAHVVSKLSERGYSIVHHRPTCAEAGDSCKHLPECVMAICVCGDDMLLAYDKAAEEDTNG